MLIIFQGHSASWLDARTLCRERCMDLISIETYQEFKMVQDIVRKNNLHSLWTSGRLCNFKGCNKPHLQPRIINGWFWSGSSKTIASTNSTPPGWPSQPWSYTGNDLYQSIGNIEKAMLGSTVAGLQNPSTAKYRHSSIFTVSISVILDFT